VDLGAIETALKQLWKPPGTEPAGADAQVRACMANLLVYCATGCDAAGVSEELAAIVRVQPSRVLLLVRADDRPGQEISAEVAARCHLAGEGHHICSEQITVSAARNATDRLPSTARPLLIGDLPTSLWWLDDDPPPLGGEVLRELEAMADQIIFASDRWPDPVLGTLAVGGWAAATPPRRPVVADLAWRRLKPWRRLISQTLDPAVLPGALAGIDHVDIEFGTYGYSQACLLTGWLASRLGWRPDRALGHAGQDSAWTFGAAHGAVQARLRRSAAGEHGLQRLVAGWSGEGGHVAVTFTDPGDGRLLATSPVLGDEPRTLICPPNSRAALVAAELQDLTPDRAYRDALGACVQLTRPLAR
jgi:glucose-6-phosphate dehydrogenase assembly protein OpcA